MLKRGISNLSLDEARVHLGFCIDELVLVNQTDELVLADPVGEIKEILSLLETVNKKIKDLTLKEKPGHLGYTSKDGADFENQEVDRMCDDSKVPSDSDLLGW